MTTSLAANESIHRPLCVCPKRPDLPARRSGWRRGVPLAAVRPDVPNPGPGRFRQPLSTLSANRINEVRFGYSRYRTSFSSLDADYRSRTGQDFDFGTGKLGLPEIDFGGMFDNLGATAYSIPRGRTSQSFQILDNFTWVRGRHTFKFGGEYRRV